MLIEVALNLLSDISDICIIYQSDSHDGYSFHIAFSSCLSVFPLIFLVKARHVT